MVDFPIARLLSPQLETKPSPQRWIRRLVLGMALETIFLMALGSATRVMNAGLACPDWPLCYGKLVPTQQMNGLVFLEWFHRMTAASMGLFAIALCGLAWWHRRDLPRWTPWAATLSLILVVGQGILGGLTVTEMLRFDLVTAHLGTALLFFVTLLAMGTALTPYQGMGTVGSLAWVGLVATIVIYAQSILGALVGSQWALHQCLSTSTLCTVMNSHLMGVLPATAAVLILGGWAWRTPALHPALRRLSTLAVGLVGLQVLVGVATFKLRLQVQPLTVVHQAIGAVLLGSLVIFTVLAFRDAAVAKAPNPMPQPTGSSSIGGQPV
jgi:cytochrome c oxidase assembly protein subunit 15